MLEDAYSLGEHLLASALYAAVKDAYGCDYLANANDWDERICEFAGCDFSVPPECRNCMHDICSRCRPKHKCARFVGDWHSRDVVLKSDAVLEHEWRTDREGCNRRDREHLEQLRNNMCKALKSHVGVSTAQWAEWELSPLGSDFIDKARTIYAPPHGFKLPLASGLLEYDHIEMMWRCASATCAFCRGTSCARYCERRGGGVNEDALASAMECAQYMTAVQREEIRSGADEQMKRREAHVASMSAHTSTDPRARCTAGCLCHEPFWDLEAMMEAYLSKDEIAQLTTRRDVQMQSPTETSRALAQQLMAVAMERKVGVPRDECARAIVAVRDRDKACYVQYRDTLGQKQPGAVAATTAESSSGVELSATPRVHPALEVSPLQATPHAPPPTRSHCTLTLRFSDNSGMEEIVHAQRQFSYEDESMAFQLESTTWSWESMGFHLPSCFTAEASLVVDEEGGAVCAPRAISLPADERITWPVWRSLPESATCGAQLSVSMQFTRVASGEYVLSAVVATAPDRLRGAHARVRWWESYVHRSKLSGSFSKMLEQGMKGAASWAKHISK